MKCVEIFKINKLGRDFVVGDIHGAYEMLRQGMAQAKFNPTLDRLFSVGDLIDRGPQSARALDFLAKPWFFAIRGNHDHDFASLPVHELRHLGASNWNGLGWVLEETDQALETMRKRFNKLPFAMEVQTRRGLVGLVHGDVPAGMSWPDFVAALEAHDEQVAEVALWGRERVQSQDESGVAGIDRVFVGHTVQWKGARRYGNVYAIDTGAVFRELGHPEGGLTMAHIACSSASMMPSANGQPQPAVRVILEQGLGPFGDYLGGARTS